MQRCRQASDLDFGVSTPGFEEVQSRIPADFVFHSATPVEINQVGAAAEQHVLTVVDDLSSSWMLIRRCPATEIGTPLKQLDTISGVSQRAASSKASKTTADDRN